jgi:benzoyl-CoA reductase/2-hydroxyglutaryl-CoA dehydratase subunit BcrC/BadD/HgdB
MKSRISAKKKGRVLQSSNMAPQILTNYWASLHKAKAEGKKIAWVSGNAPAELLWAFDIAPAYPENYAAVLASAKMSSHFCSIAEKSGFSKDLCSYARANLGQVFGGKVSGKDLPFGGLPKPDILVTTRIPCITQVKWWEVIRDRYQVPMFSLDAPFSTTLETSNTGLQYVYEQILDLIQFLEDFSGKKLEEKKFLETLKLSDTAAGLWHEIMDLRGNIPCPVGSREMCGNVFSLVSCLGTRVPVDFYTALRDELTGRVEKKLGVVENEQVRLMLDNIPLWHHLPLLSDVEKHGAVFVFETYLRYVWGGRINFDDPYRGYAEKVLTEVWLNSGLDLRKKMLSADVKKYSIDGVVFLSNRSCKRFSLWQLELKEFLEEKLSIPSILIEGDMADPEGYSQEQATTRMEAFIEMVKGNKQKIKSAV